MKTRSRKDNLSMSVVSRDHSFEENEGPNIYVDPLFADQELRDLCQLYPVEALEGELKSRIWANSEMVINGIFHRTWLLTEEYLHPHPETNNDKYYHREYFSPIILRELFEYLYPKYIKCNLAQFLRIFCFDGNVLVPLVWYGKLKDLHHFLFSLEKYFNILPKKTEAFIRLNSRDQSRRNKWWKPVLYKSITEMKSKSTTLHESDLSNLNEKIFEWKQARTKGKMNLQIPSYKYSPPTIQFPSFRPPIWFDTIPRTVIYARETYLNEEILEATIERNKLLDEIVEKTLNTPSSPTE